MFSALIYIKIITLMFGLTLTLKNSLFRNNNNFKNLIKIEISILSVMRVIEFSKITKRSQN
jgi:hypothetical protein